VASGGAIRTGRICGTGGTGVRMGIGERTGEFLGRADHARRVLIGVSPRHCPISSSRDDDIIEGEAVGKKADV
jgi:hypothetical protein